LSEDGIKYKKMKPYKKFVRLHTDISEFFKAEVPNTPSFI
jgi:hypothetical protein